MMKVVLVSCYELGHQPFNLASPAAVLKRAGFDVACFDLAVQPVDDTIIAGADLIAISTPMHTAMQLARKAVIRFRKLNPDCHICFFGLYAGLHATQVLSEDAAETRVDSVAGGEYEPVLLRLAQTIRDDGTIAVPGLTTRTHDSETSLARQTFTLPDRKMLPPLNNYAHLVHDGKHTAAGYVEASRGCAHRCLHCPITPVYQGRFRIVQPEVVLQDIEQQVEAGARHITFGDPDFLNGVKHSLAIVEKMHARFPELTFDFTAKIEHLLQYRELLPKFRQLGCLFIVSAVELLNDDVLRILDKGHTQEDIKHSLQETRAAGIALRPSFMPFTPWTSLDDYFELLDFIHEEDLFGQVDPVQLTIRLLVTPGSALLERSDIKSHITHFDDEKMLFEWRHPDRRMDELQQQVAHVAERMSEQSAAAVFSEMSRTATHVAGRTMGQIRRGMIKPSHLQQPRLTEHWFC